MPFTVFLLLGPPPLGGLGAPPFMWVRGADFEWLRHPRKLGPSRCIGGNCEWERFITASQINLSYTIDICDYYALTGQLENHPECPTLKPKATSKPPPRIGLCSSSTTLIECTADAVTCPLSGQVCIQSDGNKCCQVETAGIPASEINAKSGSCPRPVGVSVLQV
uniref:EB domain-containing protein n=1 Tax=Angiostrongylus cantonensis TaxID=6313 RepID=A0A0K0DGR7_ANGCA